MAEAAPRAGRIIAVGGGKGGAGKTVVSTNLALALAERGHRVVLVDADLGGANAHTVLGVSPPLVTLSDFISKKRALDDVAVATPFANLRLVSGALDDIEVANPHHQQKMRLLRHLGAFDTDYLVLDLGAGTGFNIVDFFLIADLRILVARPEPTSVENAYRFLKAGWLRRLKTVARAFDITDVIEAASSSTGGADLTTPADVMRALHAADPEAASEVARQMDSFSPHLIVNEANQDPASEDANLADDMASGCRRFFGIRLNVLGVVPADLEVRKSVRERVPVLRAAPTSPASRAIRTIAGRLEELTADWLRAA